MQEANKTQETTKQPIITDFEFNVIFERVIRHLTYMEDQAFVSNLWKESLPYVENLVNHKQPQFFISVTRNNLSTVTGYCSIPGYRDTIRKKKILALLVYINLYYLRRDDNIFNDEVFPKIKEIFLLNTWGQSKILELLEKLPHPNQLRLDDGYENANVHEEANTKRGPNQLCIKVLVKMYEKLWSRLGMNGCSNNQKAIYLSAISGYGSDTLEDRLSRNFDLTERDHRKDVDKANEILKMIGIKNLIKISKNN